MSISPETIFYAFVGGVTPAIFWLWFWLREDRKKPEPAGLIALSFLGGMIGVLIAYPLEKIAFSLFSEETILLFIWAFIEEVIKYGSIALVAFKSRFFDEPVDALIYMITVALGFAALENTLFLIEPITNSGFGEILLTGNMRFIGSTLLHVVASGTIGVMIGLTFYKHILIRQAATLFGLFTAICLHTLFNFFIINNEGKDMFSVFLVLWISIIILIFLFEKVKRIKSPI